MNNDYDYIKQNGRLMLSASDRITIPMIFKNLIGHNIKGIQYTRYLKDIAFDEMGFTSGQIEYWRNDKLMSIGIIPNL